MPFAESKQLHHLPRIILVRMLRATLRLVQPDEHGRVPGHRREQFLPVSGSEPAKGIVLEPHQVWIPDFLGAGGEMAVPEESQFFLKRPGPFGHALQPPAAQLNQAQALLPLHFTEQIARLLFQRLALGRRCAPQTSPQFAKFLEFLDPLRIRLRPGKIWGLVRDALVIQEARDRAVQPQLFERLNFGWGAAKTGAIEQMRRSPEIPLSSRQRAEHNSLDAGASAPVTITRLFPIQ